MWLYLALTAPLSLLLIYHLMKNGFLTFGIGGLKQVRDHSSKEWKTERAVVPIESDGVTFEIETDVKWCPSTDEIYHRNPEDVGMFDKDWIEISEYSDLYEKLLSNFRKKYQQPNRRNTNRTQWTTASYDERRRT